MYRLEDPLRQHFEVQTVYLAHGKGIRTLAILGMQSMLRSLALEGLPKVISFEWSALAYDHRGRKICSQQFTTPSDEDLVFDSEKLLGRQDESGEMLTGSVYIEIEAVIFEKEPAFAIRPVPRNFNGIFLAHRPGNFVTGVHLYHSMMSYGVLRTSLYYARRLIREISSRFKALVLGVSADIAWKQDAIAASVVRASSQAGSKALVIFHNDNPFPGASAFLEFRRSPENVYRRKIPFLSRRSTHQVELDSAGSVDLKRWAQVLCCRPPLGLSRFLTGEKFSDGSFCVDHNYFQQPRGSTWGKISEVRFFSRSLLSASVIGPSNPWLCMHNSDVRSEIAVCNQFYPSDAYEYDVRVFDEAGELVFYTPGAARVEPYGMVMLDISAALDARGIHDFCGTYVISYGRGSTAQQLPSRLHAEGIYRFRDGYWNGVQSDASIWSSPTSPIAEIEDLSGVRVRRRQLWYALAVETADLESLIAIANLSYSLSYDQTLTLRITLCSGLESLGETKITLAPFGSILIPVREMFPEHFPVDGAPRYRTIKIFPVTGKTYCASFLIRDRATKRFVLEHVLPMPKFEHEK